MALPWAVAAVSTVAAIAMALRATNVASPGLPPLTYTISTSPEPLERVTAETLEAGKRETAVPWTGSSTS